MSVVWNMYFVLRAKKLLILTIVISTIITLLIVINTVVFAQKQIENSNIIKIPVLMHHDVLKQRSRQNKYTTTPIKFEKDLKYLYDNEYKSVVIKDIVDFVESGKALPQKPVIISFDDGHYNNVYYAEPLLAKYNMKAVMFIVGAFSEKSTLEGEQNPSYSYVNWDTLKSMSTNNLWDIQSHSWDLHGKKGVGKNMSKSNDEYSNFLKEDFLKISDKINEITGKNPIAFAYPYGLTNDTAEEVLKELGYKATFTSFSGESEIKKDDSNSLFGLCRFNCNETTSLKDLLNEN